MAAGGNTTVRYRRKPATFQYRITEFATEFLRTNIKNTAVSKNQFVACNSVKDIAWTLGNASYWWPNKPFREDYSPKLQVLKLTVSENTAPVSVSVLLMIVPSPCW